MSECFSTLQPIQRIKNFRHMFWITIEWSLCSAKMVLANTSNTKISGIKFKQ